MDTDDSEFEGKSKSQLKREAHDLQRLGDALTTLKASELAELSLPEPLLSAIEDAKQIKQHGARRRQMQYIGKLMRHIDVEPIIETLKKRQQTAAAGTAQHRRMENWRDRLIAEGDTALGELMEAYPQADRNQIRQLLGKIRSESERGLPPTSARALFRLLRELMTED